MSNGTHLKIENFTWKELLINSLAAFNTIRMNLKIDDPKRELYETMTTLTHYALMIEKDK